MTTPTLLRLTKSFSKIASCFVFLVGLAVLAGWALDIAVLKSVIAGWPAMSALTALAFALSGVALRGAIGVTPFVVGESNLPRRWISQSCSGIVIVIGLLRLCDYLM